MTNEVLKMTKKRNYGFRLSEEDIELLDQYQKCCKLSTRTEALRNIIKTYVPIRLNQTQNPNQTSIAKTETEQPLPKEETETQPPWKTDPDTLIVCPNTGYKGKLARCEKCAKENLQKVKECEAIPEDWREFILEEILKEQEEEETEEDANEKEQQETEEKTEGPQDEQFQQYANDVKPEVSEDQEQKPTQPGKQEIAKMCCLNMLKGEVTENYCRNICDESEDRKKTLCFPSMWNIKET